MNELDVLVKEWYKARTQLLGALSENENFLKAKGSGKEAIEPTPLMDLWKNLSNAEWKLSDFVKSQNV